MRTKATPTTGRQSSWERTIYGEPASKANSRKIVTIKGKPVSIKSDKARAYASDFAKQCPTLDPMFTGDVEIIVDIFYASRRPDLDESIVMDAMQGKIYANDRQIRRKIVTGYLDPANPRAEIRVSAYRRQAADDTPHDAGVPAG